MVVVAALIVWQAVGVYGQNSQIAESDADSLYNTTLLPDFVISANGKHEIVPSQTLNGEELERMSALSVSDALRYFSGMQVKDYGGIGGLKTVNVRSMGSQHVGVFFDGIQIGNAQNGTVDLGRFSLDNMEMISLYNGQKSDVFQTAKDFASASAVYFATRRPVFEDGKAHNVRFKIKTGSFDLFNSSALWEAKLNEMLSSSANVEVMNTSGKYRFTYARNSYDTTEVRQNGDVFMVRGELSLFGRIKNGDWQTKAYIYGSTRGVPGSISKNDYETSLLNESRQTDRNFFVQASLRQDITKFYSYKVNAKYANDFMHYWVPRETTLNYTNSRYWQQELYGSLSNMFTVTRFWSINAAADLQWSKLNARGSDAFNEHFIKPRRLTFLGALATSLRLRKLSVQGSVLYTHVNDTSAKGVKTAGNRNIFTPTGIISYTPWDNIDLSFRAFYKRIFRLPTFNDLYYEALGNRSLKPEYTTQYNVGAEYTKVMREGFLRSLNASVDFYYNEVKDKIIAMPGKNLLEWMMLNLGYVEIRGVDVAVNTLMSFGEMFVNSRLTYTYQKAQNFTDEENYINTAYGDQIPYTPWHSGSLILSFRYRTWDLNYSFIYTGERYALDNNTAENYLQPWYTHDLSLYKTFNLRNVKLKAGVEVNNIFNQQYEVIVMYPMPGTNFKINLTLVL